MRPISLIVSLLLFAELGMRSPAAEAHVDPHEQLAVMLQLDNMLETCPGGVWGKRAAEVDRQFELVEEAGVHWVRTGIPWEAIEPKRGQWNWAAADHVVHSAKRHHLKLLWLVGNTAPWDSDNKEWNGVPRDLANPDGQFPHFVRELVQRYKGDIHYWEIRNEPNLDYMWHRESAAKYALYLAQAHRVIHQIDPQAHVVFGGLGDALGKQTKWFKEVLVDLRKKNKPLPFDIANFHVYPGEADNRGFKGKDCVARYLDSCGKQLEKVMHEEGLDAMPVWITEYDYPANPKLQPDPEFKGGAAGQAKLVTEMFGRLAEGHPERKIFWASLLDDFNDPGFESMGLVASNKHHDTGAPRPAYRALKQLLVH